MLSRRRTHSEMLAPGPSGQNASPAPLGGAMTRSGLRRTRSAVTSLDTLTEGGAGSEGGADDGRRLRRRTTGGFR